VVIVLGAEVNVLSGGAMRAFGTPTVVHFCAVLLVSAIMSAPWTAITQIAVALGACGLIGTIYGVWVVRHARRQKDYEPVWEDWVWHTGLPFLAYIAFLVAAVRLNPFPAGSMFLVGGGVLLLLFVGIHNAWDSVTYIAMWGAERDSPETSAAPAPPTLPVPPAPSTPTVASPTQESP
jgi:amino acid transporter